MSIWEPVDTDNPGGPTLFESPEVSMGDILGNLSIETESGLLVGKIGTKGTGPYKFDDILCDLTEDDLRHARAVIDALLDGFHEPRTLRRDPSVTPELAEVDN